jgi:cytosine/adenosine deaminase-related metal-dependent hydrolase
LGALALQPLLVHGVQVSEADVKRIAASGGRVVHCPRSNSRLHCGRMPLELYFKHGVPVYLGTESLASSPSLDVREEAEAAVELHEGRFSAKTIQAMLQQPLTVD